jgi:putative nucleotidyltransferase with HDIG domain
MDPISKDGAPNAGPKSVGRTASTSLVRLSQVVSALSYALDLTEGLPEGHSVRSCLIGMRIAREIGMNATERSDLFYALLLKDLGCSSNAAEVCQFFDADDRVVKKRLKLIDWTSDVQKLRYLAGNVSPSAGAVSRTVMFAKRIIKATALGRAFVLKRCDRGAEIARTLGLSENTAEAIRHLDEHFDGHGQPHGIKGAAIPILARIASVSQTTEVFIRECGLDAALQMARERSGKWFDPELVNAFVRVAQDESFVKLLEGEGARAAVCLLEPEDKAILADEESLDLIAEGFAQVIDAKSPWTHRHSIGVANLAVGIATQLGVRGDALRQIRRGGMLHDIGKLGVSSQVLEKPGALNAEELRHMREHTVMGERILQRVTAFRDLAKWASAHHERLDGKGYPYALVDSQISTETRILSVADICQAISEERPYRPAQPRETALKILREGTGTAVCGKCVEALIAHLKQSE